MSSSRHMACKTCRDRKVRCPGEQPTCEKCRRSGDTCVYVSPLKQSKADIAQTIESLQERLAKAEAQLKEAQHKEARTFPSDYVVFDSLNGLTPRSPFSPASMGFTMHRPQSSHFPDGIHTPPASYSEGTAQMSDLMALVSPNSTLSLSADTRESCTTFFDSLPAMVSPMGLGTGRAHDDVSIQPSPFPSLRDLRALNATPGQQPQQLSLDGTPEPSPLVQELAAFSSSVRLAQADAAGMASVLADYLGWAKKFASSNLAMASILETLESRAREIAILCSANTATSLERLTNSMCNPEDVAKLRADEEKIQNQLAETAEFFHSSYDIQAPLAVQRRP